MAASVEYSVIATSVGSLKPGHIKGPDKAHSSLFRQDFMPPPPSPSGFNNRNLDSGPFVLITGSIFRNNSVEAESVGVTEDQDTTGFPDAVTLETTATPTDNSGGGGGGGGETGGGETGGGGGGGGGSGSSGRDGGGGGGSGPGVPLQSQPERFETRGQVFGDQILTGRGGGLALILNSASSAGRVQLSDCLFLENVAQEFGGGAYILLQGSHSLTITRNW